MAKVKILAPVTVFHGGQYVAPGTEIEVEDDEAKSLIGAHGEYGGPAPSDPANTQILNVIDKQSLDELNKQSSINKGFGRTAGSKKDALPSDDELSHMNKAELVELADSRGVEIEANDTKAEILEKLKA